GIVGSPGATVCICRIKAVDGDVRPIPVDRLCGGEGGGSKGLGSGGSSKAKAGKHRNNPQHQRVWERADISKSEFSCSVVRLFGLTALSLKKCIKKPILPPIRAKGTAFTATTMRE